MRMSGFILGGVVGAAAALYMSKKNRQKLLQAINWDMAANKAGQFVRSAKNMWDLTSEIKTANLMGDSAIKQQDEEITKSTEH